MTPTPVGLLQTAPAGESALLVRLADEIGPAATARVLQLSATLDAAAVPGVVDRVPGYTTLLVVFDPALTTPDALRTELERLIAEEAEPVLPPGRLVTIPVAYGDEHGPDLPAVAAHLGLSESAVIEAHAAAEYRVACLGFVPGFAYLVGLPPDLAVPRLPSPRPRVPPGSVGIGGSQTGVYPFPTPGGWNLIGRSPIKPFDPVREEPFLLATGDRVRFRPISAAAYDRTTEHTSSEPVSRPVPDPTGTCGTIHVLEPGLLTTVQDLGRPNQLHRGVSLGGALDRTALILGNRLVGNDPGAAGLEITLSGPRLRFARPCVIAVTGADLGATLDGAPLPSWEPVHVPIDGELAFRPDLATGRGARAYLCVAGGLDVSPILGSRSTDLAAHFGGLEGRALRRGDLLQIGEPCAAADALLRRRLTTPPPVQPSKVEVRVILGPQRDRFTAEGIANLLSGEFRASSRSDRMGLRLEGGRPISHRDGADLISEGIVPGSIQVPGDAQPIVLLPACATMGGYPKIATVIQADLDRLAQVRPGDQVRFAEVSLVGARALGTAHQATHGAEAIVETAPIGRGWSPSPPANDFAAGAIARLAEALRGTRFADLRVELHAGDEHVRLDIHRDTASTVRRNTASTVRS